MEPTTISHILAGAGLGSMLASVAGLFMNAHYRAKKNIADEQAAIERQLDRTTKAAVSVMKDICHARHGELYAAIADGDKSLDEKVVSLETRTQGHVLKLTESLGRIEGSLKGIEQNLNGKLSEQISSAVKKALGG